MTNEQREVIDRLEKLVRLRKSKNTIKYDNCICSTEDLDTVLSVLKEKDELYHKALTDLVKADRENIQIKKQIDLMAFNLADYVMYYEYDKCRNPEMIKNKAEELKQYFERKIEK